MALPPITGFVQMNFRAMNRELGLAKRVWVNLPDFTVVCKEACKVVFPAGWTESQLAQIGEDTYVVGFWALVVGNSYDVCNAMTMIKFDPGMVNQIKIGDEDYYELYFDPGTTVIPNRKCVKDDTISYKVGKRFVDMGRIPVYMDEVDVANLFSSTPYFCGNYLGAGESVLSCISGGILRDPNDLSRSVSFLWDGPPVRGQPKFQVVPLRDVQYGTTNTTAKLSGSFADIACNSALVNVSERPEPIEDLLRR